MCGLISGAVAQFLASPMDLVKVQMQTEGLRKLQKLPPRLITSHRRFMRETEFCGKIHFCKH